MKKNFSRSVLVFFSACFFTNMLCLIPAAECGGPPGTSAIYDTSKLQLPFLENTGQLTGPLNSSVKYYTYTQKAIVFITHDGDIGYFFNAAGKTDNRRFVIREHFDVSGSIETNGENTRPVSIQYFTGSDPEKWTENVSAYDRVRLEAIGRGISVALRTDSENVEKIFTIEPGVPVESLQTGILGANDLEITESGELRIGSGTGSLTFTRPVAYQETEDGRKFVDVAYVLKENGYGFKLGKYDPSKQVVIDPLLSSAVIGGMVRDYANSIAADSSGNVYIAGETTSSDFPVTPGVYDGTNNNSQDGFIVKLDKDLKTLLSATFIGGSKPDVINSLHISGSGNVYVGGHTQSFDLPVTDNAYDKTFGGSISDGFIAKLDNNLRKLGACTYLGGANAWSDDVYVLTTDGSGKVIIAGSTWASDFPVTAKGFSRSFGGGETDAFVVKMDGNLSTLIAASFLGGSEDDWIHDIAIDKQGNIFLGGRTYSPDLPVTAGAYDENYDGDDDAFIAKVTADLDRLVALTYLNGNTKSEDMVYGIALDGFGNVYVTGATGSKNFPVTAGAYDTEYYNSNLDVFVSKFSPDLKALLKSTYLGGGENDRAFAIGVGADGNVYVTGRTDNPYNKTKFPVTAGAADTTFNGGVCDAFIAKFNASLSSLLYSSLAGGEGEEEAYDLLISSAGIVYVTGYTQSPDYPVTADAYQLSDIPAKAERSIAFVSKFDTGQGGSDDDNNDDNDNTNAGGGGGGGGGCFVGDVLE